MNYFKKLAKTKEKWEKSVVDKLYEIYKRRCLKTNFGTQYYATTAPPGLPEPDWEDDAAFSPDSDGEPAQVIPPVVPQHWVFNRQETENINGYGKFIYDVPYVINGKVRGHISPWIRQCMIDVLLPKSHAQYKIWRFVHQFTGEIKDHNLRKIIRTPDVSGRFATGHHTSAGNRPTKRLSKRKRERKVDEANANLQDYFDDLYWNAQFRGRPADP